MVVEIVQTDLTSRRHGVNIQWRSDNTYTESLVNNYHRDERRESDCCRCQTLTNKAVDVSCTTLSH